MNSKPFFPFGTFFLVILNIILYPILAQNYFFRADVFWAGPLDHWRQLIGCMFSHGHVGHLLGNMMFLLFVGPKIEKNLGLMKYLGLYLASGVGATLGFGYIFPEAGTLGASGAISGLMAVYPFVQKSLTGLALTGIAVGFYFQLNFLASLDSVRGLDNGVANLAHVAGAVTALIIFAFYKRKNL